MKDYKEHQCASVKAEELLRFAYGELSAPRIVEHVKECAKCRDYLAGLSEVQGLVKRAGYASPSPAVLRAVREEAARTLAEVEPPAAPVVRLPERPGLSAWSRAALLAAMIVLLAGAAVYWNSRRPQTPASGIAQTGPRPNPVYAGGNSLGVNPQIKEMEARVGEYAVMIGNPEADSGDSLKTLASEADGSSGPDLSEDPEVARIEVAMLDLEDGMGLSGSDDNMNELTQELDELEQDIQHPLLVME